MSEDVKKSLNDVFTKNLPTVAPRNDKFGKGRETFELDGLTKNK